MRAGAAPLLVALHGCTQTASDFAAGTRFDSVAERAGAFVLYPEQSVDANPRRCWNWFLAAHQRRDRGEPAAILALIEDVARRHPIDRERVFVAGLSAGGALAAILAEQAPDVFAAAGIVAGVPLHVSHDVPSALAAMHGRTVQTAQTATMPLLAGVHRAAAFDRLRVTLWTGEDDRVVVPHNASLLAGQFRELLELRGASELEVRPGVQIERWHDRDGRARLEAWRIAGVGHAWSGGSFRGSHTDPRGPRASDEMMTFFLDEAQTAALPSVG